MTNPGAHFTAFQTVAVDDLVATVPGTFVFHSFFEIKVPRKKSLTYLNCSSDRRPTTLRALKLVKNLTPLIIRRAF